MANIKGKNTRPELELRRALHALGLRFRLHDKRLPGKPDIVLPKYKAAILVHGCFWHRHEGCRYSTTPATRPEFWAHKFAQNIVRDQKNLENLIAAGWRVALVWECSVKVSGAETLAKGLREWLCEPDAGPVKIWP